MREAEVCVVLVNSAASLAKWIRFKEPVAFTGSTRPWRMRVASSLGTFGSGYSLAHISVEWNPQRHRLPAPQCSRSNMMPTKAVQAAVRRLTPVSCISWHRQQIYRFSKMSTMAVGPSQVHFNVYWGALCPMLRLTTHFHLVPMLRIIGALPPLPSAFMASRSKLIFLYIEMNL